MRNAYNPTLALLFWEGTYDQMQWPFLFKTEIHRLGILCIRLWIMSILKLCHSSSIVDFNSLVVWNILPSAYTRLARRPQRFSIGFKSGLWAGQSIVLMFLSNSHIFVRWAVCIAALSCWKIIEVWLFVDSMGNRKPPSVCMYDTAFCFPSRTANSDFPPA